MELDIILGINAINIDIYQLLRPMVSPNMLETPAYERE